MIVQLNGLQHGGVQKIAENIIPATSQNSVRPFRGSYATVRAEENPYATNGVAYAVWCQGERIGYIPEVSTLEAWGREAVAEANRERAEDLRQRYQSTKAMRDQFRIDEMNDLPQEWKVHVYACIWVKDKVWKSSDELTDFDGWELAMLSINMDE